LGLEKILSILPFEVERPEKINGPWQSVVDDALDLVDLLIRPKGESDEAFLEWFQSGDSTWLFSTYVDLHSF
jgi:hypothetical protein